MSPRKRPRPNSTEGSTTSLPAALPSQRRLASQATTNSSNLSAVCTSSGRGMPPPTTAKLDGTKGAIEADPPGSNSAPTKQVLKSRSWYGSWPRVSKSSASTQVARENIMGGTIKSGSIPDFRRFEPKKNVDGSGDSDGQSIRTLPQVAESDTQSTKSAKRKNEDNANGTANGSGKDAGPAAQQVNADGTIAPAQTLSTPEVLQRPSTSSGWLGGWFGRPASPESETPAKEDDKDKIEPPQPSEPEPVQQQPIEDVQAAPEEPKVARSFGSWFSPWFFSSSAPDASKGSAEATAAAAATEESTPKDTEGVVMENTQPAPAPPSQGTWAFWSRDTGSNSGGKSATPAEQGELAVIGEGSESSPRRSSGVQVKDNISTSKEPPLKKRSKEPLIKAGSIRSNKRVRPQSMDLEESHSARPDTPTSVKDVSLKADTPRSTKTTPSNMVLPSFRNTYSMKQNPSIIRQIAQLLLRTQQPPGNHVYLVKEPPKIKKAIAIGVHGLFPATYLRPMIGQPTGTSIRFANHCAEAIRRWADKNGCADCEIEKIALEGEGKIADRVDNLWKLLLNWIEHIRSADLIVVACHSQGVPVGLMLVAKLIDLGIITTARIGVCAMAGVSLGPFPDYKSTMGILMGAGAELWQFADPESEISKRYEHALQALLQHGARITYIGSLDDQLVPLDSAVYSPASHPYIYRAVFIDGRIHAPDFIAHLVGFALKLRNLGVSDHGLIRELSVALAGSLYSGEGHSRLYDDEQVYDLAISHALETTVVNNIPCSMDKRGVFTNSNPFVLPWIMRGLLEEDFVKTELSIETAELLRQFDDWKPVTKALKDVKYRLEAVRSKL